MTESDAMLACQSVITKLARRLARRAPNLDVDELVGDAQHVALRCVRTHDASKAKLETWVHKNVVWYYASKLPSAKWRRRMARGNPKVPPRKSKGFSWAEFWGVLGDSARFVVRLAIKGDGELLHLLKVLRGLEWERDEIVRVFNEIKEALSGD